MFRTIIIFTVLLLCMRILGKRQLGELELTDGTLNVILTPAERPVTAGQLHCAEPETGYPYILISDGTVLRENLRKCGKTEEWLRGECRRQGVKSPEQVFLLTCDKAGNVYFAKREKRP